MFYDSKNCPLIFGQPGFGLFLIAKFVYSLPFLCFGLLFYVLVLGSRIITQKCSLYRSVNLCKCELGGIAPSPSYHLIFIFVILLASVCGPKNLGSSGSKKSCSCDEVVIFEESINAIKSKPLECSVDSEILSFGEAPIVSSAIAHTSGIYSDTILNGNRTFPKCSKPELEYVLVGMGEKAQRRVKKNKYDEDVEVAGCGDFVVTHICDECLYPKTAKHQCMHKDCPDCWEPWKVARSEVVVNRLLCPNSLDANFGKRLVSIVVSPPAGTTSETVDDINKLWDDANVYVKSKGGLGGSSVIHFNRLTDEGKELANKAGMKHWDWIHSQGKNWRRYVKKGIHFHYFGYIGFMEPWEEGDPFIYDVYTNADGHVVDFRGSEEWLRDKVEYALDHTSVVVGHERFVNIRYWGSDAACKFATNVAIPETLGDEAERVKLVCTECGGNWRERWEWFRINYIDLINGGFDDRPHVDKILDLANGNLPPVGGYSKLDKLDGEPPPEDLKKRPILGDVGCLGGEI